MERAPPLISRFFAVSQFSVVRLPARLSRLLDWPGVVDQGGQKISDENGNYPETFTFKDPNTQVEKKINKSDYLLRSAHAGAGEVYAGKFHDKHRDIMPVGRRSCLIAEELPPAPPGNQKCFHHA